MNKKIILFLLVIICIRAIQAIYCYEFKYSLDYGKKQNMNITIVEKIKETEDYKMYKVRYDSNHFILRVYKEQYNIFNFECGDKIEILGEIQDIERPKNLGEFNYKKYLNSNGYVTTIRIYNSRESISKNLIILRLENFKEQINEIIENNMNETNSTLFKSLIYGDKSALDENTKEMFSDVGLSHIICVSGTHINYLILSISTIFRDNKRKKWIYLLFLIYFILVTKLNLIIIKAVIIGISSIYYPKLNFWCKLGIAFIIIFLINPYCIFQVGIIFSFISVISMRLYGTLIQSYLKINIIEKSSKLKKNKIIEASIKILSQTISSQILTIPIQIYFFNKITIFSVISNIIIAPIITINLMIGFILFILIWIPIINKLLFIVMNISINTMVVVVELMYSINYMYIKLPSLNVISIVCYYYIIVSKYLFKYLVLVRKKIRNRARIIVKYTQILSFLIIIFYIIYIKYFESYMYFFYVGQGNMALLNEKTKTILIDSGSTQNKKAGNILKNFLDYKGIEKIDLVLITHMHEDHINGISEILRSGVKIERIVYTNPYTKDVEEFRKIDKLIQENNITRIEVREESVINFGDIEINILTPPKEKYFRDKDMLNVNSTVYLITDGNNRNYIFMGDSTKITEEYIVSKYLNSKLELKLKNLSAYQVSHHGSKTSSSEELIKILNPCLAIISSKQSVYGHPNKEILTLFNKYKFDIKILEKTDAIQI